MSESDTATRLCYFADYEIQMGANLKVWGQTTLVHRVEPGADLDPADVLARVQQQAAHAHGVRRSQVRVRALNRM
jgi:hypothetical protein